TGRNSSSGKKGDEGFAGRASCPAFFLCRGWAECGGRPLRPFYQLFYLRRRLWCGGAASATQDPAATPTTSEVSEMAHGWQFYMNPGPTNIPDRILRAMDHATIDFTGAQFRAISEECFAGLKRVFKTEHTILAYAATGHGAWEAALVNLFSPGDKALAASATAKLPRVYWDWRRLLGENTQGYWNGTVPVHFFFGLQESLRMLEEEGLDNLFARHHRLAEATRRAVRVWRSNNGPE